MTKTLTLTKVLNNVKEVDPNSLTFDHCSEFLSMNEYVLSTEKATAQTKRQNDEEKKYLPE